MRTDGRYQVNKTRFRNADVSVQSGCINLYDNLWSWHSTVYISEVLGSSAHLLMLQRRRGGYIELED